MDCSGRCPLGSDEGCAIVVTVEGVLDVEWLRHLAATNPPAPPTSPPDGFSIAAWNPDGTFHRMFHGLLVYESPSERRYFVPRGSRVWNWTHGGWSAWRTTHGAFKRFLHDRWWNETLMADASAGRYYDVASPPWFGPARLGYVDLFLDVQKRRGRLRVVDQREWDAFLLDHTVDQAVQAHVRDAAVEASHYGAVAWRNAWDRMEGECRGWVRTLVVETLRETDVKPSSRPLDPERLTHLLDAVGSKTGRRLAEATFGKTPSERLPRSVYEHLTGQGSRAPWGGRPRPRRSP
jgi:protein associated with RNAse G/E